jgi:hypothetical protein
MGPPYVGGSTHGSGSGGAGTVYHPRNPTDSPLWTLLDDHHETFRSHYPSVFEKRYGFL